MRLLMMTKCSYRPRKYYFALIRTMRASAMVPEWNESLDFIGTPVLKQNRSQEDECTH
jgi:hypothetical protein